VLTETLPINAMGATGPKPRGEAGGQKPAPAPGTRARPAALPPAVASLVPPPSAAAAAPSSPGGRRSFTFPSDFAASRDVQIAIMQDVIDCGFDEESTFAIRISLEEAIVNAIRHGNRLDATKAVRVESDVNPVRADITVEDEGAGFERGDIPDPTHEENLCRPNGRGILLIESYMTHAEWDRGGRRVRMIKHAAVPAAPGAGA
jgi:serine/threonine-protein kinase RsbW